MKVIQYKPQNSSHIYNFYDMAQIPLMTRYHQSKQKKIKQLQMDPQMARNPQMARCP